MTVLEKKPRVGGMAASSTVLTHLAHQILPLALPPFYLFFFLLHVKGGRLELSPSNRPPPRRPSSQKQTFKRLKSRLPDGDGGRGRRGVDLLNNVVIFFNRARGNSAGQVEAETWCRNTCNQLGRSSICLKVTVTSVTHQNIHETSC